MRKWFKWFTLLLLSLMLVACGNSGANQQTSTQSQGKVHLIVTIDTNTIDEQVAFDEGDTVMDVLKANYAVEETDGFITAIDGQEQNPAEKLYWMFDVNGEMAPKAANQIKVQDGDKIEFYQEKFEN
ncbi:DUF4430 domain-containing protein [Streptococcus plurextorum]|uniref:DUF4430 domain-containing protein n=1 Tax=Streptococcus plurextorum TaxID=456876 RepID=UPI00041BBD2C|nr:DUF4430 domain-containing protein [Streptococcus plurextorum]